MCNIQNIPKYCKMHCKCDGKRKNSESKPKTYIDLSLSLFAIFTFPITHTSSFAKALFTFLSEQLKIPREEEDNLYAKLFCVLGGKKHTNKVYHGKCGNGEYTCPPVLEE